MITNEDLDALITKYDQRAKQRVIDSQKALTTTDSNIYYGQHMAFIEILQDLQSYK